ncbi:MAG: hypothetical protein D6708_12390, partial [Candidatus Dadabacteria bacterium]
DTEGKVQEVALAEKAGAVYARAGSAGPVYKMPAPYLKAFRDLAQAAQAKPAEDKAEEAEAKKTE